MKTITISTLLLVIAIATSSFIVSRHQAKLAKMKAKVEHAQTLAINH